VTERSNEGKVPVLHPVERRRQQYLSLSRRVIVVCASIVAFDLVAGRLLAEQVFVTSAGILTLWIAACAGLDLVARRLTTEAGIDRLFVGTFILHVVGVLATHWSAGGGWWLGATFLGVVVIVAVTMLDGMAATFIVSLATFSWAMLIWVQAFGLAEPPAVLGTQPIAGNLAIAFTQVVLGTIGIAALVILQRAQVRSVKRSEESWRLLVDTAPDLILTLDANGSILSANDTVVRVTGYAREDLVGRPLTAFADGDAELVLERFGQVLQGEPGRFEHRFRRADGSVAWLQVSAASVRDDARSVGLLLTARDVTEERSAAEECERLQHELAQGQRMQAIGRLVSGVAHELNNPLTAIIAFTEQLRNEEGDGERRQMLAMVHQQALRSRDIVRDLLAVVRKREGRPAETTAWTTVLGRLEAVLRAEVERLGARLIVWQDPVAAPCTADPVGLEQVLTNLVVNAAQAAGQGGTVTVRVVGTSPFSLLIVEDDGPGIPADVLGRIFEPFYTTKAEGEGTGLGLSVSLGIVEQFGGSIRAENRRPSEGGGARFTVTLPRAAAGPPSPAQPSGASFGAGGKVPAFKVTTPESARLSQAMEDDAFAPPPPPVPEVIPAPEPAATSVSPPEPASAAPVRRVLIVDDEDVIRLALRRYFQRRNWVVIEADDGDVGLAILRTGEVTPDVIVSDLRMPGAGGIELHGYLERERPDLMARLIISTGDVASPDAASFLERVRCTVLEKPFDLAKLEQAVSGIIAETAKPFAA
jgi:PAS domain S-box-containing protein